MVKQRTFILALAAALLLVLLVGSVAFADGPTTGSAAPAQTEVAKPVKPVCVDGYVINHREKPVDGTEFDPQLAVTAVRGKAANEAADAAGKVLATALVDAKGYFRFTGLPSDTPISFQLQLPDGWDGIVPQVRVGGLAQTTPTSFTYNDDVNYCYRIVFKIRRLVTLTVFKWEERLDGTVQPGEDWVITATPINDPWAVTTVVTTTGSTDTTAIAAVGQALLTLTPGDWNITETVKPGWVPLTPSTVKRHLDQYNPVTNEVVFKNREPVCHPKIIVTKLGYGTNVDGKEIYLGPLAGWTFTVSRADNAYPPITKVTAGDGQAVFKDLYPGVYKVTETVLSGWEVMGDNPVTAQLVDCETANVTFENKELIGELKITGKKTFKAWVKPYKGIDVGLDGWTITATLVGTDTSITTTTDALGNYEFTADALKAAGMGFPGASIKVCEEERDHWIPVTPECVTIKFPYPVPTSYTGAVVNFTNQQDPPVQSVAPSTAPAVSSSGCSAYYTVSSGDTLAKIAGKLHVSASSLIRANRIRNADVIYLGQRFCVP